MTGCVNDRALLKNVDDSFTQMSIADGQITIPENPYGPLNEPSGYANGPEVEAAIKAANASAEPVLAAPRLRIMAFNAKKLNINRSGHERQWILLVQKMSEVDVVMLTDFAGDVSELSARAESLASVLNASSARLAGRTLPPSLEDAMFQLCNISGDEKHPALWNYTVSSAELNSERGTHAILVKHPFRIQGSQTCASFKYRSDIAFQNPPLSVLIQDTRSETDGGFPDGKNYFVVTMVHLPHSSGDKASEQRDVELNALFKGYWSKVGKSFPRNAMHLIGGDLNVFPTESKFRLSKRGWGEPQIPQSVSTTAGKGATDNFIIDKTSTREYTFYPYVRVLALAPDDDDSQQLQVSEHFPIELEIYNRDMTEEETEMEMNQLYESDNDTSDEDAVVV